MSESAYEKTLRVLGQEGADRLKRAYAYNNKLRVHEFRDGRQICIKENEAQDGHLYYNWNITAKDGAWGWGLGHATQEMAEREAESLFGFTKWNVL